ncbi:hypothetical protein, partial [Yersinia massiliensis]|uniref:hypothetical protein n=1 Tax=Yersinia massiliensis TaxID=419257 RepID=UPI001C9405CC
PPSFTRPKSPSFPYAPTLSLPLPRFPVRFSMGGTENLPPNTALIFTLSSGCFQKVKVNPS